jgi:hypothetical protein
VICEDGLHTRADRDLAARVAGEVSDHANAIRLRNLDPQHDVGHALLQRRVHRVPNALPAEHAREPGHALEAELERVTAVSALHVERAPAHHRARVLCCVWW